MSGFPGESPLMTMQMMNESRSVEVVEAKLKQRMTEETYFVGKLIHI